MHITDLEDRLIRGFSHFANYNRERSYLEFIAGGERKGRFDGSIIAHIYRKGTFSFSYDVETGRGSVKRIK